MWDSSKFVVVSLAGNFVANFDAKEPKRYGKFEIALAIQWKFPSKKNPKLPSKCALP